MVAAAGAGGKKIKKLLPSRATQDPEVSVELEGIELTVKKLLFA